MLEFPSDIAPHLSNALAMEVGHNLFIFVLTGAETIINLGKVVTRTASLYGQRTGHIVGTHRKDNYRIYK